MTSVTLFLFLSVLQRDKADAVMLDMDAPIALAYRFFRCANIDPADQIPQSSGCQAGQIFVLMYLQDKLFYIFTLSLLYFNILLKRWLPSSARRILLGNAMTQKLPAIKAGSKYAQSTLAQTMYRSAPSIFNYLDSVSRHFVSGQHES